MINGFNFFTNIRKKIEYWWKVILHRFSILLEDLCESYFRLPRNRRLFVGWGIVIISLSIIFFAIYGIYNGVVAVYHRIELISADFNAEDSAFVKLNPKRTYVVEKLNKKRFYYGRDFNDKNSVHLEAAQRIGIQPIVDRDEAEIYKKKLEKISDCQYYKVDRLTHSIPYLIPEASDFLLELGIRFQDYSGTESRFIITSVLRTRKDVKRLKRSGNVNASPNSAHFYGTTIDITYTRFDRLGKTTDGKLKEALARALYDMKEAGYCYVKYERKQACFHITVCK